ncbi:MAG TPA: hypothetical protein VJR89_42560, partial [Polyangiales bacterium]|nr:hypothetical protein [Polyangiales bacterium]
MTSKTLWITSLLALAACSSDSAAPAATIAPGAPTDAQQPGAPTSPGPGTPPSNAGVPAAGSAAPSSGPSSTPSGVQPPAANGGAPTNPPAGTMNPNPETKDPAACRGLNLEGMIYSPGGDVLPNKCEPFHPTKNNPYAVRCIDAWPWYKTKFPGDEFCILPPPPDKGIQYGVHPQGKQYFEQVSKGNMSGYENLSTEWTMEDGEEEQRNYQTSAGNAMPANYYRNYNRMRPGSHHMIVASEMSGTAEKWAPGGPSFLALQLPGAQRPDENTPKSLEKPAEDKGLYNKLPANAPVVFNMHHFNASGKQILKETWTNLWWETDATTELKPIFGLELSQTSSLAVQPQQTVDLHYSWNVSQPFRWVTAFGHRHAWTTNFSAWIENPDGKLDIVYRSLDWFDEPTYRYDSATMNPVPAANDQDGAASGILMVKPGQKIHFNCHI